MPLSNSYAAHQPNFFPWLGYFHKISNCEVFVVLDDVQFPKSGKGTYINRTRLLLGDAPKWFTAPVNRAFSGTRLVCEMDFSSLDWKEALLRCFDHNYAQAEHFVQTRELLQQTLAYESRQLSDFNVNTVFAICRHIGLDTSRILLASSLNVRTQSTERLRDIGLRLGRSCYLCGGGAGGYQDDALLAAAGIEVRYQSFSHPSYAQTLSGEFTPGLSILDVLAHVGADRVCRLLQTGEAAS